MRQRTVEAVNTKKSRELYALDFSNDNSNKIVFSTNFSIKIHTLIYCIPKARYSVPNLNAENSSI